MRLKPVREVVQHAWLRLPSFFPIRLDAYMLMIVRAKHLPKSHYQA